MDLYPLTFRPIFQPRIWGGRALECVLGKPLPSGEAIGESWELCGLETDQSVVRSGPAQGRTLAQIVREWGPELLGEVSLFEGRFPLLLKFLDAQQTLSVQVHPDAATAARLGGAVRVKHEAWYIIDAAADACIYRGFRPGVTASEVRDALAEGRVVTLLNRIPVRKGQCYYLPSGTVHALGAGVLVAEVQTPSDVTYRLYDWDRLDALTGRSRELHVDEALACISWQPRDYHEEVVQHVASVWTTETQLIRSEAFAVDRVRMVEGVEQEIVLDGFVVWMMLEGRSSVTCPGFSAPFEFTRGDTVLIPAGLKSARIRTESPCLWLEVSVPLTSGLTEYPRPDRASLRRLGQAGAGFVQLNPPPSARDSAGPPA